MAYIFHILNPSQHAYLLQYSLSTSFDIQILMSNDEVSHLKDKASFCA